MSEPKPAWNVEFVSFSSPDEANQFEANRRHAERVMMSAFAVPAELLRPHVGATEAAQQQEKQWRGKRTLLEDALLGMALTWLTLAETADSTRRMVEAAELLRLKMIGRRCQMVTAVVLIVVYLLVWMGTR